MSRYIDADKLFLHFNDWALAVSPDERHSDVPEYSEHKIHEMIYRTINEAMSAIEQQPTADVVEVVRCKDCKYGELKSYAPPSCRYYCKNSLTYQSKDFYCSMGERREDDNG